MHRSFPISDASIIMVSLLLLHGFGCLWGWIEKRKKSEETERQKTRQPYHQKREKHKQTKKRKSLIDLQRLVVTNNPSTPQILCLLSYGKSPSSTLDLSLERVPSQSSESILVGPASASTERTWWKSCDLSNLLRRPSTEFHFRFACVFLSRRLLRPLVTNANMTSLC